METSPLGLAIPAISVSKFVGINILQICSLGSYAFDILVSDMIFIFMF